MHKHIIHRHPPFKIKKSHFSNKLEPIWFDYMDDMEVAYHPFDLPATGWWSNQWVSYDKSDEKK
ncbi:hypothetical protein [Natranaerobius trueperi]|uniref:Uncharacterized protein n=1 Tax=Natranaerobius trueperi TaxID=759412 RepID=A0A226BZT6_9FIRM|nr:hypothetical protein [Natranaerobius trueperi]OWZ84533.1 hypothetical protein CDO51_03270 [Natranaerobius trueperi]